MSSRRKSRPVRRVGTPSDPILVHDRKDTQDEQSHLEIDNIDDQFIPSQHRKTYENLPEDVCIVYPQSAGDERGEEVNSRYIDEDEMDFSVKKRRNPRGSIPNKNERSRRDGIDENIKRRRVNGDDLSGDETSNIDLRVPPSPMKKEYFQFTNGKPNINQLDFHQPKENASRFHRKSSPRRLPTVADVVASIVSSNDIKANASIKQQVLQEMFSKIPCAGKQITASAAASEARTNSPETAVDSITAGTVSSGVGLIKKGTLDPANFDEDVFDQYITKFTIRNPCLQNGCPHTTRDHFHCTDSDCTFQRFTNKADVIRHYNMHKKRDNALVHGFMRFAPNDNCSTQFEKCHLNGTSTHYHCLHHNCTKVYTSTSDVMAHENYHKRNLNLVANGFLTFPASVSCGVDSCSYRDDEILHYHCSRSDCDFISIHKSEIEQHKASHTRNDACSRQGFKKFYKNESCPFRSCPWSKSLNHFHCLRHDCDCAFTSTNQMVAHKREHDRQSLTTDCVSSNTGASSLKTEPISLDAAFSRLPKSGVTSSVSDSKLISRKENAVLYLTSDLNDVSKSSSRAVVNSTMKTIPHKTPYYENGGFHGNQDEIKLVQWKVNNDSSEAYADTEQVLNLSGKAIKSEDVSTYDDTEVNAFPNAFKFFRSYSTGQCVLPNCVFTDRKHYHCIIEGCCAAFTEEKFVDNHNSFHEKLHQLGVEQVPSQLFLPVHPDSSDPPQRTGSTPPPGFIALSKINKVLMDSVTPNQIFLQDPKKPSSNFDKKIPNDAGNVAKDLQTDSNCLSKDEYIKRALSKNLSFTSGMDEKRNPVLKNHVLLNSTPKSDDVEPEDQADNSSYENSYVHIKAGASCMRDDCKYMNQSHWHCTLNRCRYVCKSVGKAQSHRQSHDNLEVYARAAKDCFKSYTVKKMCPNPNCVFRLRGHYHCLKPGCQFVTVGTSKLPWHMKKHEKIARREASGFKYYMKNEDCGRPACKYCGRFSHYHCVRDGCTFAFQYKHQMSTHVRKHMRRMQAKSYNASEHPADLDYTNVDSGDDSLLLPVSQSRNFGSPNDAVERNSVKEATSSPNMFQQRMILLEQLSKDFKRPAEAIDFSSNNHDPLVATSDNDNQPLSGADSPDCDDESFGDLVLDLSTSNVDSDSTVGVSPNDTGENIAGDAENPEAEESNQNSLVEQGTKDADYSAKPAAIPGSTGSMFSKFRINNDVMEGFRRYEILEGCNDDQCPYGTTASHYHCLHEGCHYRFTGRTHMFAHRQHHQRVANLVRDDFRRIKNNQDCEVPGCQLENTHFHCLRCEFTCSESSRVATHRRHHMKIDSWEQLGFERILSKDDCERERCKYRDRNTTHYHCTHPGCSYTVLGLSGIEHHYKSHVAVVNVQPKSQVSFSFITRKLSVPDETSITSSNVESSPNSYTVPFASLLSASGGDASSDSVQHDCSSVTISESNETVSGARNV